MASSVGKLIVDIDRDIEHGHDGGEAWAHRAVKGELRQACHSLLLIPQDPKGRSCSGRQWRGGHGTKCQPLPRMQYVPLPAQGPQWRDLTCPPVPLCLRNDESKLKAEDQTWQIITVVPASTSSASTPNSGWVPPGQA